MIRKSKWRVRRPAQADASTLLPGYTEIERAILLSRGIRNETEARAFMSPDASFDYDPFLLHGMDKAVDLIQEAIEKGERICVYADYDADGITGAALLSRYFKAHQFELDVYFPDRFKEGYGLNLQAIHQLAASGVDLLITVDCGIRGVEQVALASELGMKVIITDHHLVGDVAPDALATINPNQPGDDYPFKGLSGVGVAYKLTQGLSQGWSSPPDMESLLDLVAVGTIADIVPLVGENRRLVKQGLEQINETQIPGLEALIHVSGNDLGTINSGSIGFGIGPRINAAGRLAGAIQAYELLLEENSDRAHILAERLDRLNKERQRLTDEVMLRVEETPPSENEKIILSFDPGYHQGVVGLAASRVTDRFYRPAFLGTVGERETRGSARSIPGFHVTHALEQVADLLTRFGGHQAAAGFTVENAKREMFIDRLLSVADEMIDAHMLMPTQEIDAVIRFESADGTLMSFLDKLEPFGNQNSQPVFCSENVRVLSKRTVGRDSAHLKLTLEQDGRPFDAIGFRLGELAGHLPDTVDVAYHLERNNYLGYETLQLRVVDIRSSHSLEDERLTQWVNPG